MRCDNPWQEDIINGMKYQIILKPEPEGGFTVLVPALPGCVTWGRNLKHARKMAVEAIAGYVECLKEMGETAPDSDDLLLTTVTV